VIDDQIIKLIELESLFTLVQISVLKDDYLVVEFLSDSRPKTRVEKEALVAYICEWLDLNRDLTSFYKMARQDPLLKEVVERFPGLRLVGVPDLFEALCWAVLGQQINLNFAYSLKRKFVESFEESITYKGRKYWAFPSYEKLANLSVEDLAVIKMTGRKSEYILGIAKLMSEGELSKEKLQQIKDFNHVEKELISIRGIGPWTANYVLMRCLRYPEAFPIADVGLMNAIKYQLRMDRKPSSEEILKLSSGWTGWEAYATFYLWRVRY